MTGMRCVLIIGLLTGWMFMSTVHSDIYGFKDKNGVYHLSNKPGDTSKREIVLKETKKRKKHTSTTKQDIIDIIHDIARREGVDPNLVEAVARAESNFNPKAKSPKGAIGVMQLMPGTAKRFKVQDIHAVEDNIEGGVRYLKFLTDMFPKDIRLAIAAYNAGERRVQRAGGIPNIQETTTYVKRVIEFYNANGKNRLGKPVKRIVDKDGNIYLTNL
jgi:soluble lytic murein transglycosylase-like protein